MNEVPQSNAVGMPSSHELLGAVEMVQTIMLEFGGLDLASKVDGDVEEYIENAIHATVGEEAPLKQGGKSIAFNEPLENSLEKPLESTIP